MLERVENLVPNVYKLRLPVMERLCKNCGLDVVKHVDGKCLFEPTNYAPGKIETKTRTVKAQVKKHET